jgi:anti-sigma regulatory factor (Ser/Thr protein kinase)
MADRRTDLRFSLAVEPAAPSALREELRAVDELADGMRPDLELLVTELVTNVVRHSGLGSKDSMEVRVRIEPGHVRVEVRDSCRGLPDAPSMLSERPPEVTGGYGLFLVDRLSSRWGINDGPGTTVWFELTERPGWEAARS